MGASEDVLAETIARYRDTHPQQSGGHIARLRQHLETQLDEVIDDYPVEQWMLVQDPGDAHVRAATTAGQFDKLLTGDHGLLQDRDREPPVPYEPISPDDFFMVVYDSSQELVDEVLVSQVSYFLKRDGEADVPRHAKAAGCPRFAKVLGELMRRRM
ncbi:hypothetical protein [Demequina sp.]|uniref:hypothetical protein n=1 Tax=Demequina sp. TaxID=2050685 RepID=UPI003A87E6FC